MTKKLFTVCAVVIALTCGNVRAEWINTDRPSTEEARGYMARATVSAALSAGFFFGALHHTKMTGVIKPVDALLVLGGVVLANDSIQLTATARGKMRGVVIGYKF